MRPNGSIIAGWAGIVIKVTASHTIFTLQQSRHPGKMADENSHFDYESYKSIPLHDTNNDGIK